MQGHCGPQDKTPVFPAEQIYGTNTPIRRVEADAFAPDPQGEGCMVTQHELFPGISLIFHDIHAEHLTYPAAAVPFPPDMISIQHCAEGRFEGEYPNGECFYLGQGDLSLNLPAHAPAGNAFPLCHYHGINLVIFPTAAMAAIRALEPVLGSLEIDLQQLGRRLQAGNRLVVFRANPAIEHILAGVYQPQHRAQDSYLRLKMLDLLLYLCSAEAEPARARPYFDHSQVQAVKEIRAFLTTHLEAHYTLQALARRYHISATALKTCFKGVYGLPLTAYLRAYRLQAAAEALRTTALPIGEIALRVGYESPSKFAEAFKKQNGQTPGQYRATFCPPGADSARAE